MSNPYTLYHYRAKYVRAYDGDTVTLDIDLGFETWLNNQTIRLYGIDTPEIRGDERQEGLKSRDYVRDRLENANNIILKTYKDKKGKYGRWLAEIFVDGENLNHTLVGLGLATKYLP